MSQLSDDQLNAIISDVAQRASRHAVRETLIMLGLDVNNPLEMQKDVATMREIRTLFRDPEFQADLAHLRSWRKTLNTGAAKGFTVMIGMLTVGFVSWVAVKLGIPFLVK